MFILYLVAVCLALIWSAVLIQRTGLLGGCLGIVLLASCFGHDFYELPIGPLPLTSDRLALLALVGFYLFWHVYRRSEIPRLDRADLIFIAFLGMLTVNTFMHNWSLNGSKPVAKLLFFNLAPAAVYLLARESGISERRLRMLCWFFAGFVVYLAVTAIGEVKQIPAIVFPRYILTSPYQEWLGRARGPFINPVTNGLYLSVGLFCCAVLWPKCKFVGRAVLVGLMFAALLGTYLTLTRSCWMGAVLGLGSMVLLSVEKRWRLPLVIAASIAAAGLLVVKGSDLAAFKRDKAVSEYHMSQSAKLRPMLATIAWKIVKDYPLFGCGFGQYRQVNIDYVNLRDTEIPLEPAKTFVQHNVFLAMITETGIVGLSLYLLLLNGWCRHAWRIAKDAQLPATVRAFGLAFLAFVLNWAINGMFHDTSVMANANLLFFLLAGVLQGLHSQLSTVGNRQSMPAAKQAAMRPSWQPINSAT